ncbi:MAG: hypothetical protein K1X64_08385 [Myxococcaceae bacterium]|nr:hypothetical protein [Myxococcaceae bacterium]
MKTKKYTALLMLAMGCSPLILNNNPDGGPPCNPGEVVATLSSVTMAQDCPDPDPKSLADSTSGACAPGSQCQPMCRQSSMQLSFESSQSTAAKIEIHEVRVFNNETHLFLYKMARRAPTQWKIDKYVSWDETVPATTTLKTSYKLSPLNNASLHDASRLTFPGVFLIEVDVAIDGVVQTLSVEAQREPEITT